MDTKYKNDFDKLEGGSKHKYVTWFSDVELMARSSAGGTMALSRVGR